jgi:hypothetical protein
MSIQGSVNSIIGGAERSIGVYKYFVNEDMKNNESSIKKYAESLRDDVNKALGESTDAANKAIDIANNKQKYWGKNAKAGEDKLNAAIFDAKKANRAAAEVAGNAIGILKQKDGSLFGRAGLMKKVKQFEKDQLNILTDEPNKIDQELDKLAPKKFKPDGTKVGGGTL